jgi:hypothetical protein
MEVHMKSIILIATTSILLGVASIVSAKTATQQGTASHCRNAGHNNHPGKGCTHHNSGNRQSSGNAGNMPGMNGTNHPGAMGSDHMTNGGHMMGGNAPGAVTPAPAPGGPPTPSPKP